jgi:hypothetical protein
MPNLAGSGSGSISQRHGSVDPGSTPKCHGYATLLNRKDNIGLMITSAPYRADRLASGSAGPGMREPTLNSSVADPDPNPDRIHRIHMFMGLLDPDLDPQSEVWIRTGVDPSITKQKK